MKGAIDGVWRNQTLKADAASNALHARSSTTPPELLTEREAAAVLGVGKRKFHQLRAETWFPQAIELGPRALRWSRSELLSALSTPPMARSNSPTLGHPKFPQAGPPDYDDSGPTAMRAAASLRR